MTLWSDPKILQISFEDKCMPYFIFICLLIAALGIKPSVLHMLGKVSTPELCPQPYNHCSHCYSVLFLRLYTVKPKLNVHFIPTKNTMWHTRFTAMLVNRK